MYVLQSAQRYGSSIKATSENIARDCMSQSPGSHPDIAIFHDCCTKMLQPTGYQNEVNIIDFLLIFKNDKRNYTNSAIIV